ncbi:MAG: hypothetical protein ACRCVJ_11910 [Clostridium sp.]|uniref:hypothetical protein n=1 Tax=Clostridium sp. TaxID=1506 RepID=UPI003F3D5130
MEANLIKDLIATVGLGGAILIIVIVLTKGEVVNKLLDIFKIKKTVDKDEFKTYLIDKEKESKVIIQSLQDTIIKATDQMASMQKTQESSILTSKELTKINAGLVETNADLVKTNTDLVKQNSGMFQKINDTVTTLGNKVDEVEDKVDDIKNSLTIITERVSK